MGKPFDDAQEQKKIDEVQDRLDGKDNSFNIKRDETSADVNDDKLFCYGCSHAASSEKFPGKPSGERTCFFCVRNPERVKWQRDYKNRHGYELKEWYDNSPIAFYPIDCYLTIDMQEQIDRWRRKAEGDPLWNKPLGGLRFG